MDACKPSLAVIGTGIAGLSAAWLLKNKFDVTVFEAQPRAGMGVHTINYRSRGLDTRIDIPLRIFCRGYYDHLLSLYDHVGVKILTSDHAGAFADGDGRMIFHYGNLGQGRAKVSFLKGQSIFSLRAWRIVLQSHLFFKRARRDLSNCVDLADITFGDYLQREGVGQLLVETVLLPMMSVTCTCDYQSVLDYPADIMLDYLTCGVREFGILSAAKGVDDIVPRLLQGVHVKTESPIESIQPEADQVRVTVAGGKVSALFDHVVVASQAQQAASMLSDFDDEKQLLQQVPFETSYMSVHSDEALLPQSRSPLSPVTYIIPDGGKRSEVSVDLTKAIRRFKGQEQVFQTWNPVRDPAPDKELARVKFTRPVVTRESRAAMRRLQKLQQQDGNRLWFCGSYAAADKIPLLDAAVDSTVQVAERLGVEIPWRQHKTKGRNKVA